MHDPQRTTDAIVEAGRLALDFGRVDRITYHPDGLTPESDTDHTVMLGLIACAVAAQHFPLLDAGRIAQYALVHDLVEVYAGDTPTLRMPTPDAKAEKAAREHAAYERIVAQFGSTLPWLPLIIGEYEAKALPEARFVKALDKLLPKVTHMLNGAVTIQKQGMSRADLAARLDAQVGEMKAYAADFPELFDIYAVLAKRLLTMVPDLPAPPHRYPFGRPGWLGPDQDWPCSRCQQEVSSGELHDCKEQEQSDNGSLAPDQSRSGTAPNPPEVAQ